MAIDSQLSQSTIATGEQQFDPRVQVKTPDAGQTQEQTQAPELDETEVAQFITACKTESETAYKDIRDTWQKLWDASTCTVDFTKKKSWQAKIVVPEIPPIIKKATSLICRILLKTDNYFDLDPGLIQDEKIPGKIEDPFLSGQKMGIRYWMERAKMEALLREWIEAAFTYGIGYLKLWWNPEEGTRIVPQQKTLASIVPHPFGGPPIVGRKTETYFSRQTYPSSTLAGKVIPPESIYTDPDHTWYIEETMTTLDQVIALGEGGLFDMDAVDRLRARDYGDSAEESERLTRLKLNTHTNPFRKKVKLQSFFGDVLSRQGEVVLSNAQVILANELIVLNPQNLDNPFWHRKAPFIELSPIKALFRREGRGLAENDLSLQTAINDMTNMTMDGMIYRLLKMFEVDPERLREPEQFKEMEPGVPILVTGVGQAIHEVPVSDVPQGTLNELEIFRRAIQNDTGVNDALLGGQSTKVATTATEVSIRSSEGNAIFEGISRVVEESIEDAIMMVQSLMLQFWDDFSDPALQELGRRYGLPFTAQSREQKLIFMQPGLKVKVRAITSFFQKSDDLKKYIDFLGMVGKIPPIAMRLNLRELLDRIVQCFAFDDPDKLVIDPQLEQMIAAAERMKLMMSVQPPQPPALPPGAQAPAGPAPVFGQHLGPQGPGGPGGPPPSLPGQPPSGPPPAGANPAGMPLPPMAPLPAGGLMPSNVPPGMIPGRNVAIPLAQILNTPPPGAIPEGPTGVPR